MSFPVLASTFANNILPIIFLSGAGFALGKLLQIEPRSLGRVVFYVFSPIWLFDLLIQNQLDLGEALRKMLDKRSQVAQLSKPATWHDFRRTCAGNLWDAKIDGVTIQKLMGHASQNQTAKYDRRPETTRRAAVKVLHVPYKSKK